MVSPQSAGDDTDTNVAKLRRAFQVWHDSRGTDPGPFMDLFADQVDFWSVSERGPSMGLGFVGKRTRKSEISTYFAKINQSWKMDYYDVVTMVANGDEVAVVGECQFTARLTGKSCKTQAITYFRFKGGKVVIYRELFDSAAALAALDPG